MKESEPSSPTPAERAFFRWQYILGSYEYARQHRGPEETEALARQVAERYDEYAALRNGQGWPASSFADQRPGTETGPTTALVAQPCAEWEAGKPPVP
jgi:hypothetical protein